jgi:hypothetical protein
MIASTKLYSQLNLWHLEIIEINFIYNAIVFIQFAEKES